MHATSPDVVSADESYETFRRAAAISVENILNYFRGEPSQVANPEALKVSRPRVQPSR